MVLLPAPVREVGWEKAYVGYGLVKKQTLLLLNSGAYVLWTVKKHHSGLNHKLLTVMRSLLETTLIFCHTCSLPLWLWLRLLSCLFAVFLLIWRSVGPSPNLLHIHFQWRIHSRKWALLNGLGREEKARGKQRKREWEKVERPEKQEGKRTERGKESLGLRPPLGFKEKVSQYLNHYLWSPADGTTSWGGLYIIYSFTDNDRLDLGRLRGFRGHLTLERMGWLQTEAWLTVWDE